MTIPHLGMFIILREGLYFIAFKTLFFFHLIALYVLHPKGIISFTLTIYKGI